MKVGLRARVSGRVQGVFFRASARDRARALGLGGWVRNCPDGSVELEAFGEEQAIADFRTWLYRGPAHARVDRVDAQPCPYQPHDDFLIR